MLKIQDHRVRVAAVRREEMRNCLLFSAMSLASDKSIHDIDVEEIIAHAQVSRGTFYKYFPSVSALFEHLGEQLATELSSLIETLAISSADKAVSLAMTSRLLMRLLVNVPVLGELFIQLPWLNQNPRLDLFQTIRRDLEQGINEGLFDKVPAVIGLNLVIGSMVGGIHTMLLKPPAKGYEDKVIRQALVGLGLEAKTADRISTLPLPAQVALPKTGILGKIALTSAALASYD
jgi:AcrR family transcriptional regulator